jgi:hypothetical protein
MGVKLCFEKAAKYDITNNKHSVTKIIIIIIAYVTINITKTPRM